MVLVMELCNSLLYNAKIGYENTYDMREKYDLCLGRIWEIFHFQNVDFFFIRDESLA